MKLNLVHTYMYIQVVHVHSGSIKTWDPSCHLYMYINVQLSWVVVLFHYPHKECVLIQTVARANSFFMTLPLRSVNWVADSVQYMDHTAIHDECLGP